MKSVFRVIISASLAFGGSAVHAQHHHHRATPWHQHNVLIDPHGHRVVAHHDAYRHVIASQPRFVGTYYTYNDSHYYYLSQPVVTAQNAVAPQPVAIEFGSFAHVDDLAGRLEEIANQFCLDLHYNYQHNPGFAETYGEAYQILQAAQWAHAREHQQDREGLAKTLGPMDDLFHHVQQDVQGWQRIHQRQVGALGIVDKMAQMESLIHHMMHEIGVRPIHDGGQEGAPPPGGGFEQAPPPPGGAPRLGPGPRNLSAPPVPTNPLNFAPPSTIP